MGHINYLLVGSGVLLCLGFDFESPTWKKKKTKNVIREQRFH